MHLTDAEIRERFEERAAMREYEGGERRERAERLAASDVRKMIAPQPLPQWLIQQVSTLFK